MIIPGVIKAMGKNAYMGLDNRLYNFRTEKPSVRSNIREGETCRTGWDANRSKDPNLPSAAPR